MCQDELRRNDPCAQRKIEIFRYLSRMVRMMLFLLTVSEQFHFTALSVLNEIMDMCILEGMYHPWKLEDAVDSALSAALDFGNYATLGVDSQTQTDECGLIYSPSGVKFDTESEQIRYSHNEDSVISGNETSNVNRSGSNLELSSKVTTACSRAPRNYPTLLDVLMSSNPSRILRILQSAMAAQQQVNNVSSTCTKYHK